MCTAHLLTVSLSGGVYLPGGVPAQGCTCPWRGGVPGWGVLYLPGVYMPGGCTYQGVYLPGERRCTCPGGVPAQVLPPVNRMTDRQV